MASKNPYVTGAVESPFLQQKTRVSVTVNLGFSWSTWKKKAIWVFPKIGVGPPNYPILIGFSLINHPFLGAIIFGDTRIIVK